MKIQQFGDKIALLFQRSQDHSVQEITDDLRPARIGWWALGILGLLVVIWGVVAPLASAVVATGFIKVASERQSVQHLEGGIVHKIHVREGDTVRKDDVLITLDGTQFHADLDTTRNQITALEAAVARLRTEQEGRKSIDFPESLLQAEDERTHQILESETQLFKARRDAFNGDINVLRSRLSQSESQIRGLEGINERKQEIVKSLDTEISDLQRLLPGKFISRHRVSQSERQREETASEIAENNAKIGNARVEQTEIRSSIEFKRADFISKVVNELSETQKRLDELKQRQRSLEDKVARTIIKAPATGKVIDLKANTPGGVVAPGMPILDVVPNNAELVIEAQLSPADVDNVHLGQMADIRLTGFKAATTPVIEGKVIHIAGDRSVHERTGEAYFKSFIQVTPQGLEQLEKLKLHLQPGAPADVIIKTGERTLLAYLLQPLGNALARAFKEE